MKWKKSDVPRKRTRTGLWNELIPPDLTRAMRTNPGQTFQLLDDSGKPALISRVDSAALTRSVPKPFRVQARAIQVGDRKTVHVWVSMDPAYWEQVQAAKK